MIFSEKKFGAGDGAQTRDLRLGKATLYQLSYSRDQRERKLQLSDILVNAVIERNETRSFSIP